MAEELTDDEVRQVADSLAKGSKIEAIKLYREFTGKGLFEAKEFVDELIPKLKEQDPERFARLAERPAGCGSAVLFCVAVVLAWYCVSISL